MWLHEPSPSSANQVTPLSVYSASAGAPDHSSAVLPEILALEPLHREPQLAGGRDAVIDVPDDPRMVDLGQQPRLPREPVGLLDPLPHQDLDGDRLPRQAIVRPVHLPHAPLPGLALDLEPLCDDVAGAQGGCPRSQPITRTSPRWTGDCLRAPRA